MAALVPITRVGTPRQSFINPSASNVITGTTETAFDQIYTLPSQFSGYLPPNTTIRLRATGVITTGLASLGFTFRIRWGGVSGTVIATSGSINIVAGLSDGGWEVDSVIILRYPAAAGTAECDTRGRFQSGALTTMSMYSPATGTFAIDTTTTTDIVLTAQWGLAVGGSIQLRTYIVDIDFPP